MFSLPAFFQQVEQYSQRRVYQAYRIAAHIWKINQPGNHCSIRNIFYLSLGKATSIQYVGIAWPTADGKRSPSNGKSSKYRAREVAAAVSKCGVQLSTTSTTGSFPSSQTSSNPPSPSGEIFGIFAVGSHASQHKPRRQNRV
jgi:hypothetical protein